jgi:hypothetical protein
MPPVSPYLLPKSPLQYVQPLGIQQSVKKNFKGITAVHHQDMQQMKHPVHWWDGLGLL